MLWLVDTEHSGFSGCLPSCGRRSLNRDVSDRIPAKLLQTPGFGGVCVRAAGTGCGGGSGRVGDAERRFWVLQRTRPSAAAAARRAARSGSAADRRAAGAGGGGVPTTAAAAGGAAEPGGPAEPDR